MSYRSTIGFLVVAVPAVALACASGMTGPARTSAEAPVVLSISPASSATGVDPTAPLVVTFSHPMMAGMEALVVLHEGTISGPPVSGTPAWSTDRTRLTFTPTQPLKRATAYQLHLSPNLTDSSGQRIDFGACAQRVGGQVVTPASMGGGMMGNGMMGVGWQPSSGTWGYGMSFTFTTG